MRQKKTSFIVSLAFVLSLTFTCFVNLSHATAYNVIYNFTGVDGRVPATNLVFDSQGNAYGTTAGGGDFDLGTVFELTFTGGQWTETVLYSFGGGSDGQDPHGGVVIDAAGNLYGTTVAGGLAGFCAGDGCGTVFKLSPSGGTWSESIIYSFTGGDDGGGPGNGLVFDSAGNLYGTTPDDGKFSAGTIFELKSMKNGKWNERVIHQFTGGNDGGNGSLGRLTFDSAGNIYGIAELGGANGLGTVYKLAKRRNGGWKFTTLYSFKGMPDAAFPYGGVILDSAGNLYGTTYYGGNAGMGTIYELSESPFGTWQEIVLYSFQGGADASLPTSTLVFGADGTLYGTSTTGGRPSCDCGTVFKLAPHGVGWKESILHRFRGAPSGNSPIYELTFDAAGNLWGTTPVGGPAGDGTVFELMP